MHSFLPWCFHMNLDFKNHVLELWRQKSCVHLIMFNLDSNHIDKIKEMWPFNCHSLSLWPYLPKRKGSPSGDQYTLSRKMSIIMKVQRTCSFLLFNTEGNTIKPSEPYPSVLGIALVTTSAIKLNKEITSHGSEISLRLSFSLSPEFLSLLLTPISFLCLSRLFPSHHPIPSTLWFEPCP